MPSPSSSTVQTLVVPPQTFPAYSRDALATATSRHTDPFNSSSVVDLRHHPPEPHPLYLFNLKDSIREFLTSLPLLYSSHHQGGDPLEMCHAILIPVTPTLNIQ